MPLVRPLSAGAFFSADCPTTALPGDVVYLTGSAAVDKVDITDASKTAAVGVVISKATTTRCVVQTRGILPAGLFTGLTPGRQFANLSARPTAVRPVGADAAPRWVIHLGSAITPVLLDLGITTITGARS